MNRVSVTIGFLFVTIGVAQPADWPQSIARLFAGDGVRCDIKLWTASVDQRPEWEGRILAKDEKIRVVNRRALGNLEPGPEEMLWTGKGAVEFMGGRPTAFVPGSNLTLMEGYLLIDLLVPLWTPVNTGSGPGRIGLEGPLGTGYLAMSSEGRPESLVVEKLSRPLWDGTERVIVFFEGSDKSVPWDKAKLLGENGAMMTFVRSKVRRKALSDDLFEVEDEGLSLADLSRPIGQLLGSDDGEYTETAGAQGLRDEGGGGTFSGGSVYVGVKPSQTEVDQFMKDGKLGRYSDE